MKINTPRAIIIGSFIIALAILFRAERYLFTAQAKAEVAGMDYYDLKSDYDFKKAVRQIVENCDISGHVEDDYLYADISC